MTRLVPPVLALTALAASTAGPAAAATPEAVRAAQRSVVIVSPGSKLVGGAVRVADDRYVTASTLVARTSEITASFAKQPESRASKVGLTDLPLGLTMLRIPAGASGTATITPGQEPPRPGEPLWILGPAPVKSGSRAKPTYVVAARRTTVERSSEQVRGLRRLDATSQPGFKGSAVVDAKGHLRGIAVPSPKGSTGAEADRNAYVLLLRDVPAVASAAPVTERSQFPAIPVTIGLGALLLLSQLGLRLRSRAGAARDIAPIPAPAPVAASAPAEELDDLEITLRR